LHDRIAGESLQPSQGRPLIAARSSRQNQRLPSIWVVRRGLKQVTGESARQGSGDDQAAERDGWAQRHNLTGLSGFGDVTTRIAPRLLAGIACDVVAQAGQGRRDEIPSVGMTRSSSVSGWDDLARVDPLWAIVSEKGKRHRGWNVDEFLATGETEVANILDIGREFGLPREASLALDFGCGVGRLTRALSTRFERCVGVDASEAMIAQAKALHGSQGGIDFQVNERDALSAHGDDSFDLVLSLIVLQHLPTTHAIETLIAEFCRVLKPGGLLVFQVSTEIPPHRRIQPRPRVYRMLRRCGAKPGLLHRMGLTPITMRAIDDGRVRHVLEAAGARLLELLQRMSPNRVKSATYFVTK
jgi:SAM-dependent methyltransferase